jgi:hypothetical protein
LDEKGRATAFSRRQLRAAELIAENSTSFCHSERSEESLFDRRPSKNNKEGFFASLRMTEF